MFVMGHKQDTRVREYSVFRKCSFSIKKKHNFKEALVKRLNFLIKLVSVYINSCNELLIVIKV